MWPLIRAITTGLSWVIKRLSRSQTKWYLDAWIIIDHKHPTTYGSDTTRQMRFCNLWYAAKSSYKTHFLFTQRTMTHWSCQWLSATGLGWLLFKWHSTAGYWRTNRWDKTLQSTAWQATLTIDLPSTPRYIAASVTLMLRDYWDNKHKIIRLYHPMFTSICHHCQTFYFI